MSIQNTEVRNSLAQFENIMEGVQFASEEATEVHALMMQAMRNLVQETDRFYEKQTGAYPKMTEESFDHFTALYQDVLKGSAEYRKIMSGLTGEDKETGEAMYQIMDPIMNLLGQDLHTLSSAKEKGLTTLPEIVERARIREVDIHGQKLDRAGEALSQRLKVTVSGQDGKGDMTGFFTEKFSSDYKTEYQEILDRATAKNPGIRKIMSVMEENSFELLLEDVEKLKVATANAELRLVNPEADVYVAPDHALDVYVSIPEKKRGEWNALVEGTGLVQDFVDFAIEAAAARKKYDILEEVGIENNEDVARRNSAMSSVADLLGMGSLIARSESMKLVNGEKQYQGNFMEPAKGSDIRQCKPGDPLIRAGVELDVENDEVKKQISDLQVLDYICGNMDRHAGNMFYQIDDRDPKHPRLIGIQGIDNDCSFGTREDGCMRLPAVERLLAISESTAKMVCCLDETVMKTLLRPYKFSEAELDAVWKRTQKLQKAIQDGYEYHKAKPEEKLNWQYLRVVKDSQWSDVSMQELAEGGLQGYFKTVAAVKDIAEGAVFTSAYFEAMEHYRKDFNVYDRQGQGLHRLNDQLKKQDKGLLTGSRQYDHIMEQAGHLERTHAESLKNPSVESIRRVMEEYKKTIQAAQEYLDHKHAAFEQKVSGKSESKKQKELEKFQDPNGRDFKRMAAASEMISELKKYQKQAETLLASRMQYEEKKTLLRNDRNKQEEYLKQQEGGRKKEQAEVEAPKRVLMSKEELFGGSAGRKSAPERPKEKERKAPEKTFTHLKK